MKIAAYARYSTDRQKKASIDDQLLVCDGLAEQLGGELDPDLIFTDQARSGDVKHKDKRPAFIALRKAIENRDMDALVVDEVTRFARSPGQSGTLEELIEAAGIVLLSGDGVDSRLQGWQLAYELRSMIGAQALRITRHWTGRSMRGRLERGYMVATPPFGYRYERIFDDMGEKKGTLWRIDEREAEIVREIFARRLHGEALGAIAKILNERGIPTPRKSRNSGPGYWRPGSILRLLQNRIYRGVFVWHGSKAVLAKAKKQKTDPKTREFDRPELRIVDDATWFACNQKKVSRNGRGGDRHPFAGLVRCGTCGAVLTVSTGGSVPALYCAQCQQARRVSAVKQERGGYLTASGLQQVLLTAVQYLISPKISLAVKNRLEEKLTGGRDGVILRLRTQYKQIGSMCERLAKQIRYTEEDEGPLVEEYRQAMAERKAVAMQLAKLEAGKEAIDRDVITKQLDVNPQDLVRKLFDQHVPAARLRALLCRLFDEVILEAKPERHVAIIRIKLSPGSVAALATSTELIDTFQITLRFRLSIESWQPTVWRVDFLSESTADCHAA